MIAIKTFPHCSFEREIETKENIANIKKKVAELSAINQLYSICTVIALWTSIVILFYGFTTTTNPISQIAIALLVSPIQHALLVLMHDASHYRILKNKNANDLISDLFFAFPSFVTTASYRAGHLDHHRYLNSDQDPDWKFKVNRPEWTSPFNSLYLFWSLVRITLGWGLIEVYQSLSRTKQNSKNQKSSVGSKLFRISYYLIIFGLMFYFGLFLNFVLFWIVPFFFVTMIILRLRSLAEHFGLPYQGELSSSRNIYCGFVEKIFFAPLNVNYHTAHHCYPSVPFYNLPKLQKELDKIPELQGKFHVNDSYILPWKNSVWKDLTRKV
jgi:fatty acid desaturase